MLCSKCDGKGAYGVTEPAETRTFPDGSQAVFGPSYSTQPCECRAVLPPRDGTAAWWSVESIYGIDVTIPIFDETFSISVKAEVPMSADNYRVHRRGNRYYPTLIDVECPKDMTLHACTARDLARALIAAAEVAERVDDADVDPRCGHWAPCECSEGTETADAVDPQAAKNAGLSTREKGISS